ncbi:MAG: beta-propeller domain-containing protein [Myxococcaceae bacterium]|nr:beta-propeller domain-containing protein [Myxococcaceae bacterium]
MNIRTNRWRLYAALTGLGLAGIGCGADNKPQPPAVNSRVQLLAFTGTNACQDLEQYIEDTAVRDMRNTLESYRDETYSYWGRGGPLFAEDAAGAPSAAGAAKTTPTDYTTTNTQVAGVDEADFVKNDGTRIFALSGNTLYASKSWPAADLSIQSKLEIEGWPREMFLDEHNRVVVFSTVWRQYPLDAQAVDCSARYCGYWYSNTAKITVVDYSDLAAPKVTYEYALPGAYNNSRRVGDSIRAVLSSHFQMPPLVQYWPDNQAGNWWEDKALRVSLFNALIDKNEKLIRDQTLADWLPPAKLTANGVTTELPFDCHSFSRVNAATHLGTVGIVTLNLANPTQLTQSVVMAEPGEIYASANNLYVATQHWWWWPQPGQKDTTYLHKFDISQADQAVYVASGVLEGSIVDQFSMDESDKGYFRVVTTVNERVPDVMNPQNTWGRIETYSKLSVMAENTGALEVIGHSDNLAPGERVMSSRIVGDKGFVVTYRQVDPLFTFDLSDPTHPKKMGELKVPGFSTYMHPLDENHLLTIGTYVPEPVNGQTQDWRQRALQLAIFDVSDLSNPKQTHVQLVGTAYGWSEAQYEHKAFNYFAAKKLLAIPFSDWDSTQTGNDYWSYFRSELKVYGVDALTGFTPKGVLSLSDMYQSYTYNWDNQTWTYYWQPYVRRSVMADDFVYAISDAGIRAANVTNLAAPLATVQFDKFVEK